MIDKAFDLADKYRIPVMILTDGLLGQMMEPVSFVASKTEEELKELDNKHKSWCMYPTLNEQKHEKNVIKAFEIDPNNLEKEVQKLAEKYKKISNNEVLFEEYNINENNEYICVAFGIAARIVKSAVEQLNSEGYNIGFIRPITLWPFPTKEIQKILNGKLKKIFVFELNLGQMVEDVKLAVNGKVLVEFYGRTGGVVFSPKEIEDFITANK